MGGGVYFNRSGDYRDSNWYRVTLRAHERTEGQLVSLLDIRKIKTKSLKALWKAGITTTEELIHANAEELAAKLQPYNVPQFNGNQPLEVIRSWQSDASRQWKEKEQSRPDAKPEDKQP